jgi:hypothetical protein
MAQALPHQMHGAVVKVARDVERQRAIVGDDGLRCTAITVIRLIGGLGLARRVPQVLGQLGLQHPLDQVLFHPPTERFELLRRAGRADQRVEGIRGRIPGPTDRTSPPAGASSIGP